GGLPPHSAEGRRLPLPAHAGPARWQAAPPLRSKPARLHRRTRRRHGLERSSSHPRHHPPPPPPAPPFMGGQPPRDAGAGRSPARGPAGRGLSDSLEFRAVVTDIRLESRVEGQARWQMTLDPTSFI